MRESNGEDISISRRTQNKKQVLSPFMSRVSPHMIREIKFANSKI